MWRRWCRIAIARADQLDVASRATPTTGCAALDADQIARYSTYIDEIVTRAAATS